MSIARFAAPAPSDGIAFVGGQYVPLAEACIAITDRGFVRSDATYDVVHVWKGRFFRLSDHIERFHASMAGLRMSLPYSRKEIADILHECVRRSGLRDAYVQMTCTRGVPPLGSRDPRECENQFSAFAQRFVWIANEQQRREGLSMIVSSHQRIPPEAIDPRIKNFHWLDLTMGIFEAYDRGALVAVLPDRDGNVTEGAGFNVFIVKNGVLATPDHGVFEGMTRRTVIELAEELQQPVEVRPVSTAELRAANEIFLTSTAGGVMPVTTLDGKTVGDGQPGPLTRRLHDFYWQRHDELLLSTPIDYAI
ncbi:aminotransferase class IV [Acidiphilium sp. AL]|uniref:aminotransferase class IV n=1 Tax=Acidiphilium sp. AL TaxID=2871704 RepID=UPI0021CAFC7A|nr:aminotransferase class IV [Acidiphilium sp. AL]MCU4162223.1 aminotransferase class IV [Acidiphilium sp. AL]